MWALDRAFHPVGSLYEGPQKGPGARLVGPGVGSLWAMRQPTSGRAAARAQQASGRHRICSSTLERDRYPASPVLGPACRHVDLSRPGSERRRTRRDSPRTPRRERRETRFASFRDVMGFGARAPRPIIGSTQRVDEVSDVYKTKMGSSTVHAEESRYRRHPECLPLGTRTANMEQHKHAERSEPELPPGALALAPRPPI